MESYRGFVFGTLNLDAPPLVDYLGGVAGPLDEWLDRHPGGKVVLCEANRLKFKGNWKLLYDNSADGYHVVFSHRSLLAMENRFDEDGDKGMASTRPAPTTRRCTCAISATGTTSRTSAPTSKIVPARCGRSRVPHPGMEHFEASLRQRLGDKADRALDLASSEPVNINVFPNLHILGNHIQVSTPVSVDETDTTWYGTAVVDEDGDLEGTVDAINALRMRTQEILPQFRRGRRSGQFRAVQVGFQAEEDEWVYMHRGLGIPDRFQVDDDGVITGPPTDEVFMREHMREWKRLMTAEPRIAIARAV